MLSAACRFNAVCAGYGAEQELVVTATVTGGETRAADHQRKE